jgi:8-oxo-dGTP diphosphatase
VSNQHNSSVSGAVIRVVAAVIQRGDSYLVCKRPEHKRHGGLWEFPGGKIHAGETLLDAASRELAEELDVDVLSVGELLLSVVDPGSEFVIEFVETRIVGEPVAIEHDELAWVEPGVLLSLPLAPSDRMFAWQITQTAGES